jgi:hypothetical protein
MGSSPLNGLDCAPCLKEEAKMERVILQDDQSASDGSAAWGLAVPLQRFPTIKAGQLRSISGSEIELVEDRLQLGQLS